MTRYRSELAAKFARERKRRPTDWLIVPDGSGTGWVTLVYVGRKPPRAPRENVDG